MATIKISDLTKLALTDEQGMKLRRKMEPFLEEGESVELDFEDIKLFASMFCNASIGFFILKYSPEVVAKMVKLININKLGLETFEHSIANATLIYKKNLDCSKIEDITKKTIDEF